jgi:GNAT superfamily N-acetyltransferase
MVDVVAVDPHDEVSLRSWWDANQAAFRADRPEAVLMTWPELRHVVAGPSAYYSWRLLLAREDGRPVGTAMVGLAHRDNTHLADLEVTVLPAARRRGVGTALAEEGLRLCLAAGRTTVIGEAHLTARSDAPVAFARSLGFESVHEELHLVLPLPVTTESLVDLQEEVGGAADDYDILTWVDRPPARPAAQARDAGGDPAPVPRTHRAPHVDRPGQPADAAHQPHLRLRGGGPDVRDAAATRPR